MQSLFQSKFLHSIWNPSLSSLNSSHVPVQDYLIGLRGLLVVQTFLFVFLQVFAPTAVVDSKNTSGPFYQIILRKTLSVLLWNESFIYSFVIFLSARTICLPFLTNKSAGLCSSAIFRRGIRLFIPVFAVYSLSAAIFNTTSTQYLYDFIAITGNESISVPIRFRNFLVYFNSLFDIFWLTKWYDSQAANQSFPSGTIWIISVIFQQSYTVYMTMVIVPFTRTSWRVKALLIFIVTAWWVQSWAWYSITGLLLADAVCNMNFQSKSRNGFHIGKFRVPMWSVYCLLIAMGVLLQYLFIAWRPDFRNLELKGHTGLYNDGPLNSDVKSDQSQARDDNYLIILGVMLLVETYDILKKLLRSKVLVELGRRSLSIFLIQPLMTYTIGITLYVHMHKLGMNHELDTFVCFVTCLPLIGLASELFYRIVDVPSIKISRKAWTWIKR